MFSNPIVLWSLVGVIFFILDRVQTKYNLTNATYASFTVAVLLLMGVMRTPDPSIKEFYLWFVVGHIIVFFFAIGAFAFILRDTTPKTTIKKDKEFFESIVGKTAEAGKDGINSVSGGEIILGGEIFKAKLPRDSEEDNVDAGTKMLIKEIVGDIFIVTVKK